VGRVIRCRLEKASWPEAGDWGASVYSRLGPGRTALSGLYVRLRLLSERSLVTEGGGRWARRQRLGATRANTPSRLLPYVRGATLLYRYFVPEGRCGRASTPSRSASSPSPRGEPAPAARRCSSGSFTWPMLAAVLFLAIVPRRLRTSRERFEVRRVEDRQGDRVPLGANRLLQARFDRGRQCRLDVQMVELAWPASCNAPP